MDQQPRKPYSREVLWLVLFVLTVPLALFVAFFVTCSYFFPLGSP